MQYCIEDAKAKGKSGVCLIGADRQKAWLTDQSFAESFGFKTVDTTPCGYKLLSLSFDGNNPQFCINVKKEKIESDILTIYYDMQCPFILKNIETIESYCRMKNIPLSLIKVDSLEKAKSLPCVFNNWALFYKGRFQTLNVITDVAYIDKLIKNYN